MRASTTREADVRRVRERDRHGPADGDSSPAGRRAVRDSAVPAAAGAGPLVRQAGLFVGLFVLFFVIGHDRDQPTAARIRKLSLAARKSAKADFAEIVNVSGTTKSDRSARCSTTRRPTSGARRRTPRDREEMLRRYVENTTDRCGRAAGAARARSGGARWRARPDRDLSVAVKEVASPRDAGAESGGRDPVAGRVGRHAARVGESGAPSCAALAAIAAISGRGLRRDDRHVKGQGLRVHLRRCAIDRAGDCERDRQRHHLQPRRRHGAHRAARLRSRPALQIARGRHAVRACRTRISTASRPTSDSAATNRGRDAPAAAVWAWRWRAKWPIDSACKFDLRQPTAGGMEAEFSTR